MHRFGFVVIAIAGVLAACDTQSATGVSVSEIDCTTATVPTYTELSADALTYCTECHGASRADGGYRYDSYDLAVQGAAKGASEIESGSMPEDSDMPDDAAEDFLVWATCGTPE